MKFLPCGSGGLPGRVAHRQLHFLRDLWHFDSDFLSERRAEELKHSFDFFVGVVLVVDSDKLIGKRVGIVLLLKDGEIRVYGVLRFVIVLREGD